MQTRINNLRPKTTEEGVRQPFGDPGWVGTILLGVAGGLDNVVACANLALGSAAADAVVQ